MNISQYIFKVLKTRLMIVFSWGFHKPSAIDNGLRFEVDGFLYSGTVEIIYDFATDLFNIRLINRDGSVKETHNGIAVDELVDTVDALVEKCDNYEEKVKSTYSIG